MQKDRYISFDWAMKRMLRDKANFAVLEGLLTVLLNERITILDVLESEGNQETEDDKFNRVDIKVSDSKGELIIVEIQNARETFYLERILYGVSKAITEHIKLGNGYNEVKKVISISILYFDLGRGNDYLYHGQTHFVGVNKGDELMVTTKEWNTIARKRPEDVFPEYYLIRVNEFNKVAKTPLEQWIHYLKTGEIRSEDDAPGLSEARERLSYYNMSKKEQLAFDEHLNALMIQNDVLDTAKREGRAEGLAEGHAEGLEVGRAEGLEVGRAEGLEVGRAEGLEVGRAEGLAEGVMNTARNLKSMGVDAQTIIKATGLTKEQIDKL